MPRVDIFKVILSGMMLVAGFATAVMADERSPNEVIDQYVAALVAGDSAQAESFWLPADVDDSHRLGITIHGLPAKYDCGSQLVNVLSGIRQGSVKAIIGGSSIMGDTARVAVTLRQGQDSVTVIYHLLRDHGAWRIATRLRVYADTWPIRETRFCRVHFHDTSLIDERALEELDRFVNTLCRTFGISAARIAHLEESKLDYYICPESEMERLTGHLVHGMTHLGVDAVVSQHLPHNHELVHAITNYALREMDLHTLPVLQEGLAVHFGGRWGKSAVVMRQLGHFMLEQEFAQLEDVLTWRGFHLEVGNLDISYAMSGLLVGYLLERQGMKEFLQLYRGFSGSDAEVQSLTVNQIKSRLTATLGSTWAVVLGDTHRYARRFQSSGIVPGSHREGDNILSTEDDRFKVASWESDDAYHFAVTLKTELQAGVLLLDDCDRSSHKQSDYQSRVFERQTNGAEYTGERFGIEFTPAEVGLYDYVTDIMLAKYVLSFDPSDAYWDSEAREIRFGISKSLLPKPIDAYAARLVVYP